MLKGLDTDCFMRFNQQILKLNKLTVISGIVRVDVSIIFELLTTHKKESQTDLFVYDPLDIPKDATYTFEKCIVRNPKKDSVCLAVYPEIFLTSKEQTSLGKLLAEKSSVSQIIVQTRSPFVLDGIRMAVKAKELKHTDVTIHHFTLDGNSIYQIESPLIESCGNLNYWPKGFFDQTMKNRAVLACR